MVSGIFLGICPSTGQYMLHCFKRSIIKMARTIRALPHQAKSNAENIEAVRVPPFDLHKSAEPGVILQERPARTSAYMDTPKAFLGVIISAGMALARQPKVILMRVAPEL